MELTEDGVALAEMALETNDLWDENDPWARYVFWYMFFTIEYLNLASHQFYYLFLSFNIDYVFNFPVKNCRFVLNALKAKEFYKRDIQYIVRNGKALIVNEVTSI